MESTPKPRKKVVSIRLYMKTEIRRGLNRAYGIALLFAATLSAFGVVLAAYASFMALFVWKDTHDLPLFIVYLLMVVTICGFAVKWGVMHLKRASAEEQVIPLTKANAGHLPTDQVLLRSVHKTNQTAKAQLLRVSVEKADTDLPPEYLNGLGSERAVTNNNQTITATLTQDGFDNMDAQL